MVIHSPSHSLPFKYQTPLVSRMLTPGMPFRRSLVVLDCHFALVIDIPLSESSAIRFPCRYNCVIVPPDECSFIITSVFAILNGLECIKAFIASVVIFRIK